MVVMHIFPATASLRLYDPRKELQKYRKDCAKPSSDCESVTDLPTCLSCHGADGITLNVSHADDTPNRPDPEQLIRDIRDLLADTRAIKQFVEEKKKELVQSVRI